jgi:hypothetical protein
VTALLYLDQNYLSGIARARLELLHDVELYPGRRADVVRLRDRLSSLTAARGATGP